MKNSLLLLYKEGGVVHDTPGVSPTTPLEIARRISGRSEVSRLFGRISLISIVDSRIADKAHRVFALIAACSWRVPCVLAYEEIAFAVNSSRVQVIRHVGALEGLGYIAVTRARNQRNAYSVPGMTPQSPSPSVECPSCHKPCRRLGKAGVCRGCAASVELERQVRQAREFLGDSATDEEIAAHLHIQKITPRITRVLRKLERAA